MCDDAITAAGVDNENRIRIDRPHLAPYNIEVMVFPADCSIPPGLFTVVAALGLYPLFEREDATELDVLQSLVQCCVLVLGSSAFTQGGHGVGWRSTGWW